ncbi:MAG: carboxynorspermidine decarboxylase [Acholeplasmatales bacterium]|nr:carboxynorspermidine decarboxylase [Acholeplasmatales bacterium]
MIKDLRDPFIRFKDVDPYKLFEGLKTPCYVLDKKRLIENGIILKGIQDRTGARILLAQKCFSNYDLYNTLEPYLAGTEASGLYEARLGREEMPNKEVHVFCGAYRRDEIEEVIKYSDHIIFNSLNQLKEYGPLVHKRGKSVGIRINPEKSTQHGPEIYDPCSKGSRLGIPLSTLERDLDDELLSLIDGIHFHTLCQQNSDDLKTTLLEVDKKFSKYFKNIKWMNFGGGHHIVRSDYDIKTLEECIKYAQDKWNVIVYLEPGEGVVLNAGYLLSHVLDRYNNNGYEFIITDTSAACHMPDVVEMPYLPPLYMADLYGASNEVRLGGPTCLAGDNIGTYKFYDIPKKDDLLIFGDMALYTTCKDNTFNGMPLPNIYVLNEDNTFECLTDFGYNDFKYRLGKFKKNW